MVGFRACWGWNYGKCLRWCVHVLKWRNVDSVSKAKPTYGGDMTVRRSEGMCTSVIKTVAIYWDDMTIFWSEGISTSASKAMTTYWGDMSIFGSEGMWINLVKQWQLTEVICPYSELKECRPLFAKQWQLIEVIWPYSEVKECRPMLMKQWQLNEVCYKDMLW